jgi:LysM repeat protein
MKTLLISTALFTAPLVGTVSAQSTASTLTSLVSEQERQIQELKTEVSSLRSLLNLERRKNGKVSFVSTSTPISTTAAVSTSSATSHTVKAGDTFSSVSRRYGVSVSSLLVANPDIKPSSIAIGQKLVIPNANSKPVTTATKPSTKSTPSSGSTYKVSKGDTFYDIAKMHKISLATLSSANPGVNPSKLKIGQTLNLTSSASKPSTSSPAKKPSSAYQPLPTVVKSTPANPKTVAKSTPAPAPKPTPTPTPKPKAETKTESYVQQSGNVARTVPVSREMTYGEFAKQHGTSISVLNTLNGLDLPADEPMAAGSELFIPNN